jgi:hypothetical protein
MIRNYFGPCGDWLTNRAALRLRRLYPLGDNSCTSPTFSTLDPPLAGLSGLASDDLGRHSDGIAQ